MKKVKEIHEYWTSPYDGHNLPENYFQGNEKTQLICNVVSKLKVKDPSILELGCNVGRNLEGLRQLNDTDLYGIEINLQAIELAYEQYPYLAGRIAHGLIEDILPSEKEGAYDIVFTMAVLEHIHPVSAKAIFKEMVRVTGRYLITIEDEVLTTWRHFPRKYDKIFTDLGLIQIESMSCAKVKGLGKRFMLRIFEKK